MAGIIALVFAVIIGLCITIPKGDYSFINGILIVIAVVLAFIGIGYAFVYPIVGFSLLAVIAIVIIVAVVYNNIKKKEKARARELVVDAEEKPQVCLNDTERDAVDILEMKEAGNLVRAETQTQEDQKEASDISYSQKMWNDKAVRSAKSDFSRIEEQFKDERGLLHKTIDDIVFLSFDHYSPAVCNCYTTTPNTDFSTKVHTHGAVVQFKNLEQNVLYLKTIRELGKAAGISIVPIAIDHSNKIERTDIPFTVVDLPRPVGFALYLRCTLARPNADSNKRLEV